MKINIVGKNENGVCLNPSNIKVTDDNGNVIGAIQKINIEITAAGVAKAYIETAGFEFDLNGLEAEIKDSGYYGKNKRQLVDMSREELEEAVKYEQKQRLLTTLKLL